MIENKLEKTLGHEMEAGTREWFRGPPMHGKY